MASGAWDSVGTPYGRWLIASRRFSGKECSWALKACRAMASSSSASQSVSSWQCWVMWRLVMRALALMRELAKRSRWRSLARGERLGADLLAREAGPAIPALAIGDARDLDMDVNAVEQRASNARHAMVDLHGSVAALALRVAVVGARAPARSEGENTLTRNPDASIEATRACDAGQRGTGSLTRDSCDLVRHIGPPPRDDTWKHGSGAETRRVPRPFPSTAPPWMPPNSYGLPTNAFSPTSSGHSR